MSTVDHGSDIEWNALAINIELEGSQWEPMASSLLTLPSTLSKAPHDAASLGYGPAIFTNGKLPMV